MGVMCAYVFYMCAYVFYMCTVGECVGVCVLLRMYMYMRNNSHTMCWHIGMNYNMCMYSFQITLVEKGAITGNGVNI